MHFFFSRNNRQTANTILEKTNGDAKVSFPTGVIKVHHGENFMVRIFTFFFIHVISVNKTINSLQLKTSNSNMVGL